MAKRSKSTSQGEKQDSRNANAERLARDDSAHGPGAAGRRRTSAPTRTKATPGDRIRAGTSGFAYKEWVGPFYPEGTRSEDMLAWYAQQLPAVEINNTFYRMPKRNVVQAWAAQVGDEFRFAIKASRRITHQARLGNIDEPIEFLVKSVELLKHKLGAVLFQLPPNMRKDMARLDNLLTLWPRGLPAAIEFRHESWLDDEVRERLNRAGMAMVHADDEGAPEYQSTTEWHYLRLRGPRYDKRALTSWLNRAREGGLIFFKHEDAGAGPKLAVRCNDLVSTASDTITPARAPARPGRAPRRRA